MSIQTIMVPQVCKYVHTVNKAGVLHGTWHGDTTLDISVPWPTLFSTYSRTENNSPFQILSWVSTCTLSNTYFLCTPFFYSAPFSSVCTFFFCSALFCFSSSSVTLWHWFLTAVPLLATTREFPFYCMSINTTNDQQVFYFTCQGEVAPFTPEDPMLVTTFASNSSVCFLLPETPCSARLTCCLQPDLFLAVCFFSLAV